MADLDGDAMDDIFKQVAAAHATRYADMDRARAPVPTFRRLSATRPAGPIVAPARRITLSEDQRYVYELALHWCKRAGRRGDADRVLTIGGYAGTGKSVLIAELARELQHVPVAFVAYTGKAANNLKQKLRQAGAESPCHSVSTIHGLIYDPEQGDDGAVKTWGRRSELGVDLVVVDEASMVDEEMLEDLLSYGIPVLAVGDHGQLPPVRGAGNLMQAPTLRLERIHRQAADNPIIKVAEAVRTTGDFPRNLQNSEHVRCLTYAEAEVVLRDLYRRREDVVALAYTNRTRQRLNEASRALCGRSGPPALGDSVVCLRNTERTLFNGMRGTLNRPPVDRGQWWGIEAVFSDDDLLVEGWALKSQFNREKTYSSWEELAAGCSLRASDWRDVGLLLDFGYAMTCHKFQGCQSKHVFVAYEGREMMTADMWSRWIYTAVTRASEYLYVVVP